MAFEEYKDILVVIEGADGKPAGVSLENVNAAKSVANGGKVIAVSTCEACAKTAIEFGADCAFVIEGAQFERYIRRGTGDKNDQDIQCSRCNRSGRDCSASEGKRNSGL